MRSRFCRRLRAVSGKTFVLQTSQLQNAIAHFGLLRRTARVLTLHENKKTTRLGGFFVLANNYNFDTRFNQKYVLLFLPKSTFQH